jgi:DNA-binding MarR family transcriptional regulator
VQDSTRELGLRLRDLNRALRLLRQHGPTGRPGVPVGLLSLLMHVEEFPGGCHGRELAVRTGLDPSTVSRAVSSLLTLGLVERQADPRDGRASVLALTDTGRAALTEALDRYGAVLGQALAGWAPDEVASFCAGLDRFTAHIERTVGHHEPMEAAR